jgi:hypothetical protein
VPKKLFKPPKHLIKQWPEVFEDLYIDTMPLAYLNLLKIEFADGRLWHISVSELLRETSPDDVIDQLLTIIENNEEEILNIDFDVDVVKLRTDLDKEVKKLL